MGKLKTMPSRMATLPPRLRFVERDAHGHSAEAEPWRAWYHLAKWKHPANGLRIRVFKRDGFTCKWPGCGKLHGDLSKLVADHIRPHRGDPRLFWDIGNVETLCASPCHNKFKQQQERGYGGG